MLLNQSDGNNKCYNKKIAHLDLVKLLQFVEGIPLPRIDE